MAVPVVEPRRRRAAVKGVMVVVTLISSIYLLIIIRATSMKLSRPSKLALASLDESGTL